MNRLLWFHLVLVIGLLCSIIPKYNYAQQSTITIEPQQLQEGYLIENHPWKMYWRQLVDAHTQSNDYEWIQFPQRFDNTVYKGQHLPARGYATYVTTIKTPNNQKQLGILVTDAYTNSRIFINDSLYITSGKFDTVPGGSKPFWQTKVLRLPRTDSFSLVIQISNFEHSKGGPFKPLLIGQYDYVYNKWQRSVANDVWLSGCLFMGGLFFVALFAFGPRDKATLYFALFCLCYSYRFVGSGNYALHSFWQNISWHTSLKLEYLSLYLSLLFLAQYMRKLFNNDVNPLSYNLLSAICGLLSVCVVFTPASFYTQLLNPFLILMMGVIVYTFWAVYRFTKNKRSGWPYALASIGILLIVFLVVNLQYFGVIKRQELILTLGYIIFFFLQALILAFRFQFLLKEAKEAAIQALRAKTDFLSTMSHEIRTPLNSVIGISHILLHEQPRPDQKKNLDTLLFSAKNLLNIVNDILDFNKIEAGKLNLEIIPTQLAQLLHNVTDGWQAAAKEKQLNLTLHISSELQALQVQTDPTRLAQVLNNLIHNAIKFTPQGHIEVSVTTITINATTAIVECSVADTGIGISEEQQQIIFDRFTQADSSTRRSFGGTGLGLAICKRIIQAMNSELLVASTKSNGSRFYFTLALPIVNTALPNNSNPTTTTHLTVNEATPLTPYKILLVEDNAINVMVATNFLKLWGATFEVAENGEEAIAKVNHFEPDVILMDMHMPVMDGYEATKTLRKQGFRKPIIALTASVFGNVEQLKNDIGIDDMVVKPFQPDTLLSTILQHVRGSV